MRRGLALIKEDSRGWAVKLCLVVPSERTTMRLADLPIDEEEQTQNQLEFLLIPCTCTVTAVPQVQCTASSGCPSSTPHRAALLIH